MKENMTLANGTTIPTPGFGTYKICGEGARDIFRTALAVGYRHLDTASFYENEADIAAAIKDSGIYRSDLFLTSKVWKDEMGYYSTKDAIDRSLNRLATDYLDLYLVHWPRRDLELATWQEHLVYTWYAMEEKMRDGAIRAIGVSNFLPHHIDVLYEHGNFEPTVNQIEYHPGYIQEETVQYCKAKNILVEAWAPLGRAKVFDQPAIAAAAAKHGVSPAQICLRFAYQNGILPLPKASSKERMAENTDFFSFTLDADEMAAIAGMPRAGWTGLHPDRPRETVTD
ncbi:MAG: aldo/keto reductase [Eubacteriales bacterium]|nr:aldo/keto reductase [Eubacteriales bacterium]